MYISERLQLAKFYKKPPQYDIRLNMQVLELLQYAPLPMFAFGYWFLGNRQMFFNEAHALEYKYEVRSLNHKIFYPEVSHTTPMVVFFLFVIF
jgi:hypothetical protein